MVILAKTPGWFGKKGHPFPDDLDYTPADGLLLLDLASTSGTFENGIPIQPDEPVRLAEEDVIQEAEVLARYAAVSALYEHS